MKVMDEMEADIVIIGGGTGGVAAALAACEHGARVVMTESTDWVGGQFTAQGVPADENQWVETVGASRRYQGYRSAIREWYRQHRRLRAPHAEDPKLNPGGGWVSRLCVEPRVAHEVLEGVLRPHVASGRLRMMLRHEATGVEMTGERVRGVRVRDLSTGATKTLVGRYVLDATETGELYPLANVEHAIGAEHRDVHGEMHGRADRTEEMDQQAFSWCFAMEHCPGEDHTISRPATYGFWSAYVPKMEPAWTGRLFSWVVPSHNEAGRREFRLVPWPSEPRKDEWELWRYRRIVDAGLYERGPMRAGEREAPARDVTLVNWVQMDYWQKPLLGVSPDTAAAALREAREQSLCLLYWMQTDAPRHDGGTGYRGLRLAGDVLGTGDGFAKAPYIREPRRLVARTIVSEAHIGTEQRRREGRGTDEPKPFGTAEPFADSVGIGHYALDLHPSTAGRNSVYVPAAPFRVPMGSLIPVRVRGLLASGKGIGVTHITNGCYRMHAVEWSVGEAAGTLAAWCVRRGLEAAAVHESSALVREFQEVLVGDGVAIAWPWER